MTSRRRRAGAPPLRLGSRGSPLARRQAEMVGQALAAADPELAGPGLLEVVVVRTTGDRVTDRPLAELGGKGLFCKEIEATLLDRRIDLAVHSAKDLPTWLPAGLVLAATLERADPRDVLIARAAAAIDQLPDAAVVGTTSPRRRAQLLARRSDLAVVTLRGNVGTRLDKLTAGTVDATLLARAGLDRLGIEVPGVTLDLDQMLPAVGQGAIAIECRADDARVRSLLASVDHGPTSLCLAAERAFLEVLDGSCHTPIGGHAELVDGALHLRGLIAWPDGSALLRTARTGPPAEARALGRDAGTELRDRAGPGFFDVPGAP